MREGLTYNDVLLVPKKTSLTSRSEANTKTKFTKNISLNIPLVSSNMATVTEHKMAIALARNGGLGVIHQFSSIEDQVREVKKVKKSTSYVIENPLTINKEASLKEALSLMEQEGVSSVLVLDKEKLVGIMTKRDYSLEKNLDLKVSEVMTSKLIASKPGIKLSEAANILKKYKIEKLPLINDEKLVGLVTRQDIMKLQKWKNSCRDKKGRLLVGGAVGIKDCLERSSALVNSGVDVLVLDIAHAHSNFIIEKLKELKSNFNIDIMVGNIATAKAAEDLISAGADGLKVGIGPSPVCTTRIMSGSGVPQLSAILDVCSVAGNIPVSADGGAKYPGDITKAIAAGASTVYSGSLFSGTDESPGMIIMIDGKRFKRYMGSASYDSNHERKEKLEGKIYKEKINIFVEGVSTLVDYKGPVEEIINGLVKGLKSGISYCGASNIKEVQETAEFIKISHSGFEESKSNGKKLSE